MSPSSPELVLERLELAGPPPSHIAWTYLPPRQSGAGTILYLHGFGSSQGGEKAAFFRRAIQEEGLGFCSLDFQGHGGSGGTMKELSITRNVSDIALVHAEIEKRGAKQVIVLGSSMGGLAGLWYAAFHPEAVRAVLTIAPALDMGKAFASRLGDRALREWQDTGVLTLDGEAVRADLGWGYVEDLKRHTNLQLARRLKVPGLALQGKHDTSVDWHGAVDFVTTCPYEKLELHFFADGDHRLADRLAGLWTIMREFLSRRGFLSGP